MTKPKKKPRKKKPAGRKLPTKLKKRKRSTGKKSNAKAITAAKKQAKAMALRLNGYTLKEIAQKLGYANRSVAYNTIMAGIDRIRSEHAEEYRAVECSRMDEYLKKLGPKIKKGDVKAIDCAVRISNRRSRLLGLDQKEPAIEVHNTTEITHNELNFDEDLFVLIPTMTPAELEQTMQQLVAKMPEHIQEIVKDAGQLQLQDPPGPDE